MVSKELVLESVKVHYGKTLNCSTDLTTQVCKIGSSSKDEYICNTLSEVHPEVCAKYYGCGLCIPPAIVGASVLDLGSGSGRDCFAVSKLVGAGGSVVGVDMTKEQIEVAQSYVNYHTKKFGYTVPNVKFVEGYVENLIGAGLEPASFDVIISNCVVNLCPDKEAVLTEAYKILKPGGEMYFSDMYTDTLQSDAVKQDPLLWGEGFAGSLHWEQLHQMALEVGFLAPCLVSCSPIEIERDDFKEKLGDAKYCSATYRIIKPSKPEQHCVESKTYGGILYKGTILHHKKSFLFDCDLSLCNGVKFNVPTSVIKLISSSRYSEEFEFQSTEYVDGKRCCSEWKLIKDPFDVLIKKAERGEALKSCKKVKGS